MKRATPLPFLALVLLCLVALFAKGWGTDEPKGGPSNPGDIAWMLTASGLVLLMTPGLSFFYGGMVSFKNVVSTMLQSLVALGIISLVWVVVGFSLAFGNDIGGLIGNPMTFLMFDGVGEATHPRLSQTIPLLVFAMFQLKFAIITPALITGSFAERVRFSAYLLFMVLFSLFIYAPLAHWTWHPDGIFYKWGVKDFAGGTVVHMSAGFAALAGAMMLGRRHSHVANQTHEPANVPFVILGTGMLWFGWFGFNAGSALGASGLAAFAFATTNTASAAAMLSWMFFDWLKGNKPSALGACIGAVVGLVAITPAAGFVTIRESIVIGVVASVISNMAVHWKTRSTLDDTLDVFPCHGVGGITGMIMTGIFAKDVGLTSGKYETFLYHLLALVIVAVFAFGGSWLLYKITDLVIPLRGPRSQPARRDGLGLGPLGRSSHQRQRGHQTVRVGRQSVIRASILPQFRRATSCICRRYVPGRWAARGRTT
jgi:ammonium transporter, Amt family